MDKKFLLLLLEFFLCTLNSDPTSAQFFTWMDMDDSDEDLPDWNMDDYDMDQPSTYQSYCDNVQLCDPRASLTCRNHLCDCIRSEGMHYDTRLQKCVAEAGEQCKFKVGTRRSASFTVDCVQNSVCNRRGVCVCERDHFENSQGECTQAKGFEAPCNSTAECSQSLHLQCVEGTCRCKPGEAKWSTKGHVNEAHCAGIAGQNCIDYHCTENAICGRIGSRRVCRCQEGHFQTAEGGCEPKVKMSGECSQNSECGDYEGTPLTCVNGTCTCDPESSIYNSATKSCVGLLNSPCVNGECETGSICDEQSICRCANGFVQSRREGGCVKAFGSTCDLGRERSSIPCMSGLFCKEEKCDCRYREQEFDSGRQKCLSRIDGDCTEDGDCIGNSECTFPEGRAEAGEGSERSGKGFCSCKTEFVENGKGGCDLGYGQNCRRAGECAASIALACIDGVCRCDQGNVEYSEGYGRCVGLVGAKCEKQDREGCVENAICQKMGVGGGVKYKCGCVEGFQVTRNGTCAGEGTAYVTRLSSVRNLGF